MQSGREDETDSQAAPGAGDLPRPRLLTLITLLLLLVGGNVFFTSASDLRGLASGKPQVLVVDGSRDALTDGVARSQVVLSNALLAQHPVAVFLHGIARLALALLYLFTVAALFSRDRRGRRLGEACGKGGLVVCGVQLVFLTQVVRPLIPGLIPLLATAFREDAVKAGRDPLPEALFADQAQVFLVWGPLVVTLMGVLFSLMLMGYFRSRRLRLFYNEAG
jgi:hypothetical protein